MIYPQIIPPSNPKICAQILIPGIKEEITKYITYIRVNGRRVLFSVAIMINTTPIKPNIAPEAPKLMAS